MALALLAAAGCGRDTPESLTAAAKAAGERNDPKAAVVHLKAALQLEPGNPQTRYLLGKALLDAGDPAGAVIELSKVRDQKHPDEQVLPPLTRALYLLGDHRRLATQYSDVTLAEPKAQAELKANVAAAWAGLGDRARTEAALAAALQADPNNASAGVLQARIVAGAGRMDEAMKLARAVVDRDPRAYEAWHLIGELRQFGDKDMKAAAEAFRKSISIEPANIQAHLSLLAMHIRDRDIAGARAQAEELRKVLPRHPQMIFVDAQLAFHDAKYTRARELAQALLKVVPTHTGVLQLAGASEAQLGSMVVAEAHFAKALQVNPQLLLARRNLAQVYLRIGQPARALDTLRPLLAPGAGDANARALAAEAALALGDSGTAERLFLEASRLEPDDERIRTALALTNLSRGDAERAFVDLDKIARASTATYADLAIVSARIKRREFDQALAAVDALEKKGGDRTLAPNLRGRIHELRGDFAAARKAFDAALAADPRFFSAVASLAALDLRENKPEAATARFDAAIQADARNHLAYMGKAAIMIRGDADFEAVRKVLAEAIQAAPSDADPRLQLIEYGLKKRQFKEVLVIAQQAGAALPNQPRVLDALGRAQAQSGDRLQAASTFQRAANLDPGSALPHVRLADVYKADGKRQAAVAALKRALEIDPGLDEAQVSLVETLVAERRVDEAVAVARGLQKNPRLTAGWLLEAAIHMRGRDFAKAETALRAGLKQHPDSSDLAVRLHQVLGTSGRGADARRFAEDWVRQRPNDSVLSYQLATAAITRNDMAEAETRLRDLVKRHPEHALALNNLAWVLTFTGKPGAVAFAERAVARLPGHPGVQDTLAMALAAEGQATRGLELQKKVVALQPEDDGLRLNLARIAKAAGDTALARAELERLIAKGQMGPFHGEAVKLLKTL
jgi:putative PEP-CTERM system TPR-repeat lipoprotein